MKLAVGPAAVLFVGVALVAINAAAPRMLPDARWYDIGVGLVSLGVSLFVLMAVTQTWTVERLRALETPRRRWPIAVTGNITYLYYIWATAHLLVVQSRLPQSPWADAVVVPLAVLALYAAYGIVVVNIGLLVYLSGARLPSPLWSRLRTTGAWVLNADVLFVLLMCACAGYTAVTLGDAYTISALVSASALLLVCRAAACTASSRSSAAVTDKVPSQVRRGRHAQLCR